MASHHLHDVPAPESVPPVNDPASHPGDDQPHLPPPAEGGREKPPVELPGQPGSPERF